MNPVCSTCIKMNARQFSPGSSSHLPRSRLQASSSLFSDAAHHKRAKRGQDSERLCPCSRTPIILFTPTALMSHSHPTDTTATSSSNLQLIFNTALRAYEKRTKKDLLAHPLATELQKCNSPSAILAVLHQQVQGLDRSRSSNDPWTKWLDPTVNVLHMLSETLEEGVSLVSSGT